MTRCMCVVHLSTWAEAYFMVFLFLFPSFLPSCFPYFLPPSLSFCNAVGSLSVSFSLGVSLCISLFSFPFPWKGPLRGLFCIVTSQSANGSLGREPDWGLVQVTSSVMLSRWVSGDEPPSSSFMRQRMGIWRVCMALSEVNKSHFWAFQSYLERWFFAVSYFLKYKEVGGLLSHHCFPGAQDSGWVHNYHEVPIKLSLEISAALIGVPWMHYFIKKCKC